MFRVVCDRCGESAQDFGDHFAWLSRFLGKGDPGHEAMMRDVAAMPPASANTRAASTKIRVPRALRSTLPGLAGSSSTAKVREARKTR
jgi:hypothetical protein